MKLGMYKAEIKLLWPSCQRSR